MRHTSLTGHWSGAYRYPGDIFPETVFSATIEERDGVFFGETLEPNTADPWLSISVLRAEIEGVRAGAKLTFTKFYGGEAELDFAIRYEGEVNDAFTRAEGIWIDPELTGPFFMTRDDHGAAAEAEESAEANIEVRK